MKVWDGFTTALRALWARKLRSILTLLGILIGVAAVTSVMSLGRIQQETQMEAFASLGTNLIYVVPGAPIAMVAGGSMGTASTLTMKDAEAIARYAPSVAAVAPSVQTSVQMKAGDKNIGSMVFGVTPEYQWINNLIVAEGSFVSEFDYKGRSRVTVLGNQLAETLFGSMNPVGQTMRIKGHQFEVVGVLESKGTAFGMEDIVAYAPLSTVQSTLTAEQVSSLGYSLSAISIQAKSKDAVDPAKEEITDILRQRHHLREDEDNDFTIISMDAMAQTFDQILGILGLVLAAIAGISLLVGGIGIMNIMLVSVTERTREIGLRKAVGAKRRDVLMQFLTESATLSLCGGAIGVAFGWLIVKILSVIATNFGFPLQAMLPGDIVALAVGVSVLVGLASGIYPAVRAARLDPIEALRHE